LLSTLHVCHTLPAETRTQLNYWVRLLCHVISLRLPGVVPNLHLAQSLVTQALRDFSSPTVSLPSAQSLPSPPTVSLPSPSSSTSSSTTTTPPPPVANSDTKNPSTPRYAANTIPSLAVCQTKITRVKGQDVPIVTKVDLKHAPAAYQDKAGASYATNEWFIMCELIRQFRNRISVITALPLIFPSVGSQRSSSFTSSASPSCSSGDTKEEATIKRIASIQWMFMNEWPLICQRIERYSEISKGLPRTISLYQVEQAINSLITGARDLHLSVYYYYWHFVKPSCSIGVPADSLLHNITQICRETVRR
jgi:hypothetical protein